MMKRTDLSIGVTDMLECAKEVIKLLEQQRSIYRNIVLNCCCDQISDKDSIKQELFKLDDQIASVYQKSKFNALTSTRKHSDTSNINNLQSFASSSIFGVDMKSLIPNSKQSSENGRPTVIKRSKSFKCNYNKCRFTCFTEKSLIKHQLEHRRTEFLSIIEPHGFTLSDNNQNIICCDKSQMQLLKQCCFPFCTVDFATDTTPEIVIKHLSTHLNSTIFYPCLNCLKIFDCPEKLNEHFSTVSYCKSFADFPEINGNSGQKFKCKLCDNSYSSEQMLRLHCDLLHDGQIPQTDVFDVFDETIIQEDIFEPQEIETRCYDIFIDEQQNSEHKLSENIPEQNMIFEIDVNDESEKEKLDDTNFQTDHSIEHEVVIETSDCASTLPDDSQVNQLIETSLVSTDNSEPSYTQVQFLSQNENGDYELLLKSNEQDSTQATNSVEDIESEFVVMDANSVELLLNNGGIIINDSCTEQASTFLIDSNDDLTPDISTEAKESTKEKNAVMTDNVEETNPSQLRQLMNIFIYECSKCEFSFRSEMELAKHNYEVHQIASYKCQKCDFVTQDIEKFRRHELVHKCDTMQKFVCQLCCDSFESESDLQLHRKKNHLTFECSICKVVMQNRYTFNSHMISFHKDSILKCEHCKYKTFMKEFFDKHKRIHDTYKSCPYDNCTDSFPSEHLLDAHINKFHKHVKPHKCTECNEAFFNSKTLDKHLIQVHKEFLYQCPYCKFNSNHIRNYIQHQTVHQGTKPFKCSEPDCFSTFRTKHLLKSHQLHRHSNEKPFVCEVDECKRRFKTKSQLNQHSVVHCGFVYECDYDGCEAVFRTEHKLDMHMSKHEKELNCPNNNCTLVFTKKRDLNQHLKTCILRKEHSLISRINNQTRSLIRPNVKMSKSSKTTLTTEISPCIDDEI